MAGRSASKIELTAFDDLFQTDESREDLQRERLMDIPVKDIRDFPNHPYPSADSIKRDVKKDSLCSGFEWRGKSKKDYDDKVNGDIKKAAQDLWNSIDRMETEIYDEIARKQGQKFSLDPLNRSKAWLTAKIRNWVD